MLEAIASEVASYPIWLSLAISIAVWQIIGLLGFLIPVPESAAKYKDDIQNRSVAMVHSSTVTLMGAYRLFCTETDYASLNSDLDVFIMIYSAGYFVEDFTFMWYLGLLDRAMTIHHGAVLLLYTLNLNSGYGGCMTSLSIFWAELSNPAMHCRVIVKELGYRYSKLYEVF